MTLLLFLLLLCLLGFEKNRFWRSGISDRGGLLSCKLLILDYSLSSSISSCESPRISSARSYILNPSSAKWLPASMDPDEPLYKLCCMGLYPKKHLTGSPAELLHSENLSFIFSFSIDATSSTCIYSAKPLSALRISMWLPNSFISWSGASIRAKGTSCY